jgi:hypothetical protein
MTRPIMKSSGNNGAQLGATAALTDGKADKPSRIKTLYRIMQSVEVRQLTRCGTISNA